MVYLSGLAAKGFFATYTGQCCGCSGLNLILNEVGMTHPIKYDIMSYHVMIYTERGKRCNIYMIYEGFMHWSIESYIVATICWMFSISFICLLCMFAHSSWLAGWARRPITRRFCLSFHLEWALCFIWMKRLVPITENIYDSKEKWMKNFFKSWPYN